MITKTISWALYLANSSPPGGRELRQRFYAMKQRICERYGTPDGYDIQHFDGKKCFGCDGTGIHEYWDSGDQDYCWKCGGSGWFKRERWVTLKRWRVGNRVFHQPDGVSYEKPTPVLRNITFEGFIQHGYHGFWSEEAILWLSLVFDRTLFRMLAGEGSTYCKWPRWFGPMVHLKQFIGKARLLYRSLRKRCDSCGCHTWTVFKNRCDRCESLREALNVSEDVPF